MKLTTEIQTLLLDIQLSPDEQLADIVIDAQEYGMEHIIELVSEKLPVDDIVILDEMIDNDASVDELDTWLANKVENYNQYITQAIEKVKEYLADTDKESAEEIA